MNPDDLVVQSGDYPRLEEAVEMIESAPEAARSAFDVIIAQEPDNLAAIRGLALALRQLNNPEEAAIAELDAISRGMSRSQFAAAQEAFLLNDLENAEAMIRLHLRLDPKDPAAAVMLGEIAARCGARREADNLFKRAILLAPAYLEPRIALAKHQRVGGRYDDALVTIGQILQLKPDHLESLSLRAAIFEQQRRFEEADAAFNSLHEHHPDDPQSWANHALLLKTIGRIDDSVRAYRKALAIDPIYAPAWWGISNLKTVKFEVTDINMMRKALSNEETCDTDRVQLLYALGKALEDNCDYSGAFSAYSKGAKLRLNTVPYNPKSVTEHVAKSRAVCTPEFFEARKGWGATAHDPIFIVSLPRSGSTLVEQILSSHSMIEGTEELHDIERIAVSLAPPPNGGSGGWLDKLPSLNRDQAKVLGEHYIDATRRLRRTNQPFFTDKMPSNWVFCGLIRLILPNAKIISIRRHPMGCGFANFSQHFNWGINFSYDLEHIAGFYAAYVDQMRHFERVQPKSVHHLTYEGLVENTEIEVRRLLDYLELPFEKECLRFYKNPRAVFTPSSEQVRAPINREGMERWKRYEAFLSPLQNALGPVLEHYPDFPASHE